MEQNRPFFCCKINVLLCFCFNSSARQFAHFLSQVFAWMRLNGFDSWFWNVEDGELYQGPDCDYPPPPERSSHQWRANKKKVHFLPWILISFLVESSVCVASVWKVMEVVHGWYSNPKHKSDFKKISSLSCCMRCKRPHENERRLLLKQS